MARIDLNADLGESVDGVPTADDEAMFPLISSASIACGGHAGDDASMRDAVVRAERLSVAIGAHPSYPDPVGFGRRRMSLPSSDLRTVVAAQLRRLLRAGADVRYVKPHGALYHAVTAEAEVAGAVVAAVADLSDSLGRALPLLGLPGHGEAAADRAGLPFAYEAFLDRGYLPSGALVPRGEPGDLLHDPAEVAERAVRIATDGRVRASGGGDVAVRAASLCLHGDTARAVELATQVRAALDRAGIVVEAPW